MVKESTQDWKHVLYRVVKSYKFEELEEEGDQ